MTNFPDNQPRRPTVFTPSRGTVAPEVAAELRLPPLRALLSVPRDAFDWAVVAIDGPHAATLARDTLALGKNVWLAGDALPPAAVRTLRHDFHRNGRLLCGPAARTGHLGGTPLGISARVRTGPVGIVGTTGGAIQDALCALDAAGSGISQALCIGPSDLSDDDALAMFLDAWQALQDDPATDVVLALCRPAAPDARRRLETRFREAPKPTECLFLGNDAPGATVEETATRAAARAFRRDPAAVRETFAARDARLLADARRAASKLRPRGRYLRGLFSRGSRCLEAQGILAASLRHLTSNAPVGETAPLAEPRAPVKNALVDLGPDALAHGLPHPCLDPTLRCLLLQEVAADPSTAVILLDVSLGPGSHPDPLSVWAPLLKRTVKSCPVVVGLCAAPRDLPAAEAVAAGLRRAGAHVLPGNGAACRFAGCLTSELLHARR